MAEQSTPTPTEELEKILALVVYERGDDVREWPLDEATLYRKEKAWSFEHGRKKVRELILSKAANVVITAGWKSPAEVAELRKLIEQIKQACSDQFADYHNDDNAEMMSGRNSMADAILELIKEAAQ